MRSSAIRRICLATALASLSACGGGGGGGGGNAVISVPPPPPPPPVSPTYTPANIFPGITTSTQFATIGLEAGANVNSLSALTKNGFSVSYDAATKLYVFDFPSTAPGAFYSVDSGETYWNGQITDPASPGSFQPGGLTVHKPVPANPGGLFSYTSFGLYGNPVAPLGVVAFGVATPGSAVPISGTATYDAQARGYTLNGFFVDGTATLNFNFGAGTLGGHYDAYVSDGWDGSISLGRYTFNNTIYGVGSPAFSGSMTHAAGSGSGAFDGLFTGPNAQELMARWTATYTGPDGSIDMFGVWVGKKCC